MIPKDSPHILYVASALPARSETFVYREVLGLRERGAGVSVASVNQPQRGLEDPALDALAEEAIGVYPPGLGRLVADALPGMAGRAGRRGMAIALGGRGVPAGYRVKVAAQVMGGLALARRVRGRGITHVHAHMAHVPATVAMVAAHALGVPFSFTGHAADLFRDRMLLEPKLERAAFVACISQWHRGFYQSIDPRLPDAKLPVIRCGVDVPGGSGAAPPGEPLPATPPSPWAPADSSAPLILGVGRLVAKKGLDVLIEAAKGLAARVVIVGEGPQRGRLEALARDAPHVELVGAWSHRRVTEAMAAARLFVLPCLADEGGDRDGIPVVLMEAMARGVCVVSGDLPTIRELVVEGKTGRLVPPGDARRLGEVMAQLLEDEHQRKRLAAAGRARVAAEFSTPVNLDRLMAAFAAASSGEPLAVSD